MAEIQTHDLPTFHMLEQGTDEWLQWRREGSLQRMLRRFSHFHLTQQLGRSGREKGHQNPR